MKRLMIKIMLPILLFCMLAYLWSAAPYDNIYNDDTVAVTTLDEGLVQTTMQTENIPYTYNATQNTRNFYFVEVFIQREPTKPLRKISPYAPCNRISEYTVMGMDVSKSSEELERYSYIPFLYDKLGFEWAPFKWKPLKLTEKITAYTYMIEESSYTKFTFNGCKYKITGATKEDCLAIMDKLSAFPDLEEVYAVYGNGVLGSIEVMFIKERYKYFLRTSFAEDLDGFVAMLTAMQKEPPDYNDFTRSLIEFMDGQCLIPILLPSGYGPFTNALD